MTLAEEPNERALPRSDAPGACEADVLERSTDSKLYTGVEHAAEVQAVSEERVSAHSKLVETCETRDELRQTASAVRVRLAEAEGTIERLRVANAEHAAAHRGNFSWPTKMVLGDADAGRICQEGWQLHG